LVISLLNTFKRKHAKRKEIVAMQNTNKSRTSLLSTISYIISRIILRTVLGLIISGLVLSITGIILFVVGLIISELVISVIISSVIIISLIWIINNLIKLKTMTGISKHILSIQRVEVGVIP
jgi:ABC-type sugar transport system permease subunit